MTRIEKFVLFSCMKAMVETRVPRYFELNTAIDKSRKTFCIEIDKVNATLSTHMAHVRTIACRFTRDYDAIGR